MVSMKTISSSTSAAGTCIELDESALSAVVGGEGGDPHWADVDDEGFFGYETFTVHVLEFSDDDPFGDNIA